MGVGGRRARRARCRSRTRRIGDAFEIRAIGSPQILTGTLTRTGGVIAQVGDDVPRRTPDGDARSSRMTLPATERDLGPTYAQPRL